MLEESPNSEQIEELRQRWDADPTPQRSLRLAEEYRRLDRREDAVEILTRALEEHPNHVAAQVALGRFRIELGHRDEARRILEQVVEHDPTHLVASKLLVGLYIDMGRDKQARDRLDLYRLLNESDPEIEVLEERLGGPRAAGIPGVAAHLIPSMAAGLEEADAGGPFAGLWDGVGGGAYWEAIGAEGIFPTAAAMPPPAPPSETAPEPSAPVPGTTLPSATVTLANLYLQQGHLGEAERVLQEVLEREPGNTEALHGLDVVGRLRGEVAEEAAPAVEEIGEPGDLRSRKIAVLKNYLQRLRAAARQ